MKNAVFWDVMPCGSLRTDVSEECSAPIITVHWLLVTANVLSSPILVSLMMEALHSSKMSVLKRATQPNITYTYQPNQQKSMNNKCNYLARQ
jgi:hypothetical protein